MTRRRFHVGDEAATRALGAAIATALTGGLVVHLHGDLGAGKTTLVRGLLRELGHEGTVRSPTYTLVEPYDLNRGVVYHLDLYRLADPEELEFIGLRDLLSPDAVLLVEWPERGEGALPAADLHVWLEVRGDARVAVLESAAPRGEDVLRELTFCDRNPS